MKFATFTHLPWPEENRPGGVYESHTQQVIRAEELGFHSAWIAEHHFTRYGLGFRTPGNRRQYYGPHQ